jgi:hypothetical protein
MEGEKGRNRGHGMLLCYECVEWNARVDGRGPQGSPTAAKRQGSRLSVEKYIPIVELIILMIIEQGKRAKYASKSQGLLNRSHHTYLG